MTLVAFLLPLIALALWLAVLKPARDRARSLPFDDRSRHEQYRDGLARASRHD